MGIRIIKPTTPGNRFSTRSDFEHITTSEPEKKLTKALRKSGGRNNNGRITVRHRGGGHRRRYRIIDFKRDKTDITAKVATIEYGPLLPLPIIPLPNEPVEVAEPLISPLEDIAANNGFDVVATS